MLKKGYFFLDIKLLITQKLDFREKFVSIFFVKLSKEFKMFLSELKKLMFKLGLKKGLNKL